MSDGIIATFVAALGLSLMYSLVPGPVTIEALRRGATYGVPALVSLRMGSLIGSLAWAVAALAGASLVLQTPQSRALLSAAGIALLLLLAWRGFRSEGGGASEPCQRRSGTGNALTGLMMALANPVGAAFWLGAGGSLLHGSSTAERTAQAIAFLLGFVIINVLFTLVYAVMVAWGRGMVGPRLMRGANLLSVATLAAFALRPLIGAM
jgi:L-lysine exporter family protein LysE/ArgO